MSNRPPHRCFDNQLPEFDDDTQHTSASDSLHLLLRSPPSVLSQKLLRAAVALKDEVVQATWSYASTKRMKTLDVYKGTLGTAFLCLKAYQATGNLEDLHLCREIVQACSVASATMRQLSTIIHISSQLPFSFFQPLIQCWHHAYTVFVAIFLICMCPTFLCGSVGIYALGAVAAKYNGNKHEMDRYVMLLSKVGKDSALVVYNDDQGIPFELLFGRSGYLWATLFVNKQLGYEAISASIVRPIVDAILAAGRAEASEGSCPLMYRWHGKAYWGAAHGLAGIMHCLLHFQLEDRDIEAVKCVLRYMINNRFPDSGNYPSREGRREDKLVQWCHGTPGVALTLCKAAEVFQGERGFRDAAREAGEVVWQRGLLRKVGLCHGVSGNAYTFLALYRLLNQEVHLHRARAFGCFLLDRARDLIASGEMHGGDSPYSLFEGLAGMSCLWLDLVNADAARFPGYEL